MSIKAGRWVRATRGTDRGSIDRRTHPNFEDPAYQDADETGLYTPPDPLETDTEQLYEKAGALYDNLNYWMEPTGARHTVRTTTHDRWALQTQGKTAPQLLAEGWIRVAPPDAVQVARLDDRSRALIEGVIRDLMRSLPTRDGVWVETDEENYFVPRTPTGRPDFAKLGDIAIHHPERYEDTSTYDINYPLDTRETTEEVKTRYDDKDNLVPPRGRETQTMWPELPGEENAYQSESGLDIMSEGPSSLRGLNGPGYPPTELDTSPEWPETNMGRASGKVRAGRQGVSVRVSLGLSEEKGHE